jgi:hypothetical protein
MDVYPFPGILAATVLWNRGEWTAVDWDKKRYTAGKGPRMEIPGLPFSLPDPEMLWGFLWGRPVPWQIQTLRATACSPQPISMPHAQAMLSRVSGDTLFYGEDGSWLRQDPESRAIIEAGQGEWVLRYSDHALHEGRALPHKTVLSRRAPAGGETLSPTRPLLKATVSKVVDNPVPRPQAFRLSLPEDFERMETVP